MQEYRAKYRAFKCGSTAQSVARNKLYELFTSELYKLYKLFASELYKLYKLFTTCTTWWTNSDDPDDPERRRKPRKSIRHGLIIIFCNINYFARCYNFDFIFVYYKSASITLTLLRIVRWMINFVLFSINLRINENYTSNNMYLGIYIFFFP